MCGMFHLAAFQSSQGYRALYFASQHMVGPRIIINTRELLVKMGCQWTEMYCRIWCHCKINGRWIKTFMALFLCAFQASRASFIIIIQIYKKTSSPPSTAQLSERNELKTWPFLHINLKTRVIKHWHSAIWWAFFYAIMLYLFTFPWHFPLHLVAKLKCGWSIKLHYCRDAIEFRNNTASLC